MSGHHILSRHRFRWANGVGFALTVFYALWLLAFLVGIARTGFRDLTMPMPTAYAVVGAISLVAAIVLLGIVLFRYVMQGADLGDWHARYFLYGWTCAGGLFFLSQAIALARFGAKPFPSVPGWLSEIYWYFAVVGAVVFAVLLWVNSEGHHYPWEGAEDDADYDYAPEPEHEHDA